MKKILLLLLLALLPGIGFSQSKNGLTPFNYYCWGLEKQPSMDWLLRAIVEEENNGYIDYSSICNTNIELQDLTPTLVVFWFHTCGPAVKAIQAIYDKMAQWQSGMSFQVMLVEISRPNLLPRAKSMVEGKGWNKKMIDVYDLRGKYDENFESVAVPYYQVFNGFGKLKYEGNGYSESEIHKLYHALKDAQ